MDRDTQTPAFDAPAPQETPGVVAMRGRVSQRLFGIGTPQQLGRYTIDRRLGAGGMGVVYAAFDAELSRKVAIKLVRTAQTSARDQDRLREEARALAQLSHPNVVQIYEVGVHEQQLYLVMEYLEGTTLDHWARGRSSREILRCCVQAGHGLAAAHAVGLLHRDVKPNNIVVGADGRVRVIDFGLASASVSPDTPPQDADPGGEQTLRLVGTPAYLAPELYARRAASPHSDQFSFCVTVWQVLCGVRPFTVEQLLAVADGDPLSPTGRLRPRWLAGVVGRGLASAPEQRWRTMAALLDEIESRPRRRLLSVTFVGVALVAGLMAEGVLRSPELCPDPSPIFAEVWNPERRASLEQQLVARSGGEADFALLVQTIDSHREAWLETHASVCAATRVQRSRTDAQLERALTCLDRDLAHLHAMLELLEGPLGVQLDLRRLLLELRDPSRCKDGSTSADQIAPPPQIADRVAKLRAQIDEIALLCGNGAGHPRSRDLKPSNAMLCAEPRRASVEASRLLTEARELGFSPLLAEALALDGKTAIALRDDQRALDSLREAARFAKAVADPRLEFACLHQLVHLTTTQLEDPERGADLVALMLGSFEQLGRPTELVADALIAEAELAASRGELDTAEFHLRNAIEHLRRHADENDYRLERSQVSLANLLAEQGRLDEAIRIYDTLLARRRRVLGPQHPSIATIEFDLALTLLDAGEANAAREHAERALAIQRASYGADSVRIAPALVVAAQARAASGEIEAALDATREAWPLERQLPPENRERGNSLRFEAALLDSLGRYQESLAAIEQLRMQVGPSVSLVERAMYEHTAGWLMCRVDRCQEAGPRFRGALASEHQQTRLYARLGLVEVSLAGGQVDEAQAELDNLRPAIEQLSPAEGRAEALAELEFIALRCAAMRGDERDQLRARLKQVELAYAGIDVPVYVEQAMIELRLTLEDHP